ncbi:choline ABC transporter permease subunit [Paroceanicella profunda]|uniref:Choline ABC transporter permease subunit n=1 Tax=Paroceanicella profunda TaxID=2579971 RepID=A0A5B8FW78_9RHOB|nr:choline ABC transporter permease subunit [Paroceanicella profunda]QDL90769.1 choline ABC transporter permease subunit [Paroceanicella profunda]
MEWLTDHKIPLGNWTAALFKWITKHFAWAFDAVADALDWIIEAVLWLLNVPHPLLLIAIFVAFAWWLQRSWKICLFVGLGFLFCMNQGYWKETLETLSLVSLACALCMAIGVPLGIYGAHRPRVWQFMLPVLDLMQTVPAFVYLIPIIVAFGLGMVPGLIATVIFVLPASIRLTHLGISTTPPALIEAAQAFGATRRQVLWKVEVPSALPQIMAGLNQTIMLSLSMVVIAGLVAADGLGVPVIRALNRVNAARGFESGFVIAVVAIMLARMFQRKDGK